MYAEHRKVEAAVSSVPLVWGQGLVAWLDDYPYTCTEQLVSKGMASLLLASRPEFGADGSLPTNLAHAGDWASSVLQALIAQ